MNSLLSLWGWGDFIRLLLAIFFLHLSDLSSWLDWGLGDWFSLDHLLLWESLGLSGWDLLFLLGVITILSDYGLDWGLNLWLLCDGLLGFLGGDYRGFL